MELDDSEVFHGEAEPEELPEGKAPELSCESRTRSSFGEHRLGRDVRMKGDKGVHQGLKRESMGF